jgi:superfamily I DNA and/or RNA helicase
LANRRRGMIKTRTESHNIWECQQKLDVIQEEMDKVLPHIARPFSAKAISHFLLKTQPATHREIFGTGEADEEGFQAAGPRLSPGQALARWTSGRQRPGRQGSVLERDYEIDQILLFIKHRSVWDLSRSERCRLEAHWREAIIEQRAEALDKGLKDFDETDKLLQMQYKETDKRILESAGVIGVTTTGLAANSELLRSLPAKVLLIEEAAEVLEAHTITALLPSVEHAILIGDHLQLRAQISKYELSMESEQGKRYGLDESLFERLTNEEYGPYGAKMPLARLNVQRRMHPSIASLVRNTLYPDLEDHEDTHAHPEVPGMRRRLFWLDHQHHEDSASNDPNQTSKTNEWEAEMVLALVQHLSRQGAYQKGDIAVITPYLGQLRKLRQKFSAVTELVIGEKDMETIELAEAQEGEEEDIMQPPSGQVVRRGQLIEGLRLATVDNFQV